MVDYEPGSIEEKIHIYREQNPGITADNIMIELLFEIHYLVDLIDTKLSNMVQ